MSMWWAGVWSSFYLPTTHTHTSCLWASLHLSITRTLSPNFSLPCPSHKSYLRASLSPIMHIFPLSPLLHPSRTHPISGLLSTLSAHLLLPGFSPEITRILLPGFTTSTPPITYILLLCFSLETLPHQAHMHTSSFWASFYSPSTPLHPQTSCFSLPPHQKKIIHIPFPGFSCSFYPSSPPQIIYILFPGFSPPPTPIHILLSGFFSITSLLAYSLLPTALIHILLSGFFSLPHPPHFWASLYSPLPITHPASGLFFFFLSPPPLSHHHAHPASSSLFLFQTPCCQMLS